MIIFYKNSFLASVVSIIGCMFVLGGIACIREGEILPGILLIVLAVPIMALAKWISNNKAFKKWWKQIEQNNLTQQIAQSTETAMAIYRKNPQKRTVNAIRKLNPAAADRIEGKSPAAVPAVSNATQASNAAPAPAAKAAPIPVAKNTPAVQPKAVTPVRSSGTPEDILRNVILTCNENTQQDPDIYHNCCLQLEVLYAANPELPNLRQALAQCHVNYAANAMSQSWDAQSKAARSALRALELEPNADTATLDKRTFWLYYRALLASIHADNAHGTRDQMTQARELLQKASRYYIRQPNQEGTQLMGIALPVARCRIAFRLADNLFSQAPVQPQQALTLIDEAIRFCPLDSMRQCDLNPYLKDNTTVILTRQELYSLRTRILSGNP